MVTPLTIIEQTTLASRPRRHRFTLLYLLLGSALAILAVRSGYVQLIHGGTYRAAAESNRVAAIIEPAPRGIIYDTHGRQLVENVASTDVMFDPTALPSSEYESVLFDRLPGLLGISPTVVRDALGETRRTRRLTRVAAAVDHDKVVALEQALPELPGVQLASSLVRKYPDGHTTAHVLGYTAPASAADIEQQPDLKPTDITGKTGLERSYDQLLRGHHGVSYVEVDAGGSHKKQLDSHQATAGNSLTLSLDSALQARILELFAERAAERTAEHPDTPVSGAVIALDPRSGAVRALVSYPTFDPNIFSLPSLNDQISSVITDQARPLFNRAIDGTYPPGSTIKPLLAAAALEENIITTETTVSSTGGLSIGAWRFPDWKAGGHGSTNVTKALAESVNTFFYEITGGYQSQAGLGVERATKYLRDFGWGRPSGIDLPSEAAGFLPSPAWKQAEKHEPWYIGDTYHLAIGQGDVLATPLQIAVATATIGNGGNQIKPFVVRTITPAVGEPETMTTTAKKLKMSAATLAAVRQGMRETIQGPTGSARSLATLPVTLAGKTGTAQIGGSDNTHAWFTSFGPYEDPELVVTVLLEQGGAGDRDAVPFARQIWQWWAEQQAAGGDN